MTETSESQPADALERSERDASLPWAILFLVLLGIAWIALPPLLLFGAAITSVSIHGESPTDAERAESLRLLLLACLAAIGIPLLAYVFARMSQFQATARACQALVILSGLVSVILLTLFIAN